jgi:hypothetical protein
VTDSQTRWVIDTYWDFRITGPQKDILSHELQVMVLMDQVRLDWVLVKPGDPNPGHMLPTRFHIECKRTCAYSLAVIAVPRDIVQSAQRMGIPLMDKHLIAIMVKEIGITL